MKMEVSKSNNLKIVGDAGIASGDVGDGRFIILLIIDHEGRSDIEDLFRIHTTTEGGEVKVNWGTPLYSKNTFLLNIKFILPLEVKFTIEFDIDKQGILIENIINSKAVYLQLGKEGDRFKDNMDKQRILLEIPDTGIKIKWGTMWKKSLIKKYKAKGYSKSESIQLALKSMEEVKKFKNLKVL